MKSTSLCIFSLLVLGIFSQVQCYKREKGIKIEESASKIADSIYNLITAERTRVSKKFDKELAAHDVKSDKCLLKKHQKMKRLRNEFNDIQPCLNITDVQANFTLVLSNVTNFWLEVGSVSADVFSNLTACIAASSPFNIECIGNATEALHDDLLKVLNDYGGLWSQIVAFVCNLYQNILGCLIKPSSFESRLYIIKDAGCK